MKRSAQYLIVVLLFASCSGVDDKGKFEDSGFGDVSSPDAGIPTTADADTTPEMGGEVDAGTDAPVPPEDLGTPTPDMEPDAPSGPRDEELLADLREYVMESQTPLGYNGARNQMYQVDGIEDHDGRVECIYTGRTVDIDNTRTPDMNCALADGTNSGCQFNTEHTMPLYYLRLELGEPSPEFYAAEGDIHHLFPSYEQANTARYHFGFGNTSCAADGNCDFNEQSQLGLPVGVMGDPTCSHGDFPGPTACVMMVRTERRGDVARAQFYMSMRYGVAIDASHEVAMREWHVADPVDSRELTRNDAIKAVQGNGNPFVESPELVDRISDF